VVGYVNESPEYIKSVFSTKIPQSSLWPIFQGLNICSLTYVQNYFNLNHSTLYLTVQRFLRWKLGIGVVGGKSQS